ncbi:MAG: class I SAM-dependent methyltransferase, partial [Elusimicrobia bacterium]|nr:class I SAM-dependent methyltransferase [Elusimicrobiota bacterium]
PLPEQASLTECYQEEYFKPWISKLQEPRLKFFVKRWEKIEKPALAAKGKILDVGCGPGEFLSFAKKDGWETFGTEISAFAAAHAAKKFGLNVFTGDLREAKFPDNNFDVVTIWHVLEHMPDPSAVLKEINRIIKPSGVLVIAVPNLNNYIYMLAYTVFKLKKLKLFVMGEREIHVSFFTSKTLRNLLDKTGFKIIKETVDKGRSFWAERVIDYASGIVFNLTRKNYGIALEFHAMKKEES